MKFLRTDGPYLRVSLGEGREAVLQVIGEHIVYAQEMRGLKPWIWRAEVEPAFIKAAQERQHAAEHGRILGAYDGWGHEDR